MPIGSLLSESILGIAAIIIAAALAGTYIANLDQMMDIQRTQLMWIRDETSHRCKILLAHADHDSNVVKLWVKNIGVRAVSPSLVEKSELMILSENGAHYLLFGNSSEYWDYTLLNDSDLDGKWDPGETILLTTYLDSPLGRGDHRASFILYNGVECSYQFST
ncbi:MAG: hypothetical protein NZ918_03115 [Aigarchaeota archaeon]|nr:hypothetical protein [Aigarchaeota archaeon]MDW8021921.1 hypothetical protein [Nitrososphaerota archaeon]